MKKRLLSFTFLLLVSYCFSQSAGIGSAAPDASVALDITATNRDLLIPGMNISSINAITNPARARLLEQQHHWAWDLTGNANIDPLNFFLALQTINSYV